MLTATEASAAVPGGLTITAVTDAEVLGQPRTDKREFFGGDGSLGATIELFVNDSSAAAVSDYPNFVNSDCPTGHGKATHPKIGTAGYTDEYECLATGAFAIAFVQGAIECGVASAPAAVTEDLARAESAKL